MKKANAPNTDTAKAPAPPKTAEAAPATATDAVLPVSPATLTTEQLEELKARAAQADDFWDRLLRATADFENFKKRAARERQDAVKYASEALIQKLISVLDNFDMAQAAAQSGPAQGTQSLQAGIAMIQQQFKSVLAEAGVEEVDATGKPFNPNLHEAVSQQETADIPEGHVIQQLRKGYKLRERLLRPATVIVAKTPAPASAV
ncbi:MAG: nucleotide exchange factor GrpE [Verrucomicrobia bacterium]|nr:nucleotide exchange factor GrpE [Verrucomicrobiota bacterium]